MIMKMIVVKIFVIVTKMTMMTMMMMKMMRMAMTMMMTIVSKRHAAQCQHVHSVCLGRQLRLFHFLKTDDDENVDHDDNADGGCDDDDDYIYN